MVKRIVSSGFIAPKVRLVAGLMIRRPRPRVGSRLYVAFRVMRFQTVVACREPPYAAQVQCLLNGA